MKISKMVTLVKESINPNLESDKVWNLYSLPSFDAGKQCEIVLGSVIQSNKFIVPNRCILFNKLNVRFKRIWQIDNELPSKICSTEFLPLVVNEDKVDFNFIYYLLQSNFITNYLCGQNQSTSNSHKRIDVDNFFEIDVPVPDLPTQRKIAAVLSSLDNKIEVNRRINAKLEQMAKRIFDYWYVQFDFPNAEGKPYKSSGGKMVYNATLKREIPEGWEVQPLDSFISAFNSGDWGADEPSDSQSLEVRCIRGADINTLANLPKRFIKNANTYKLLSNWNLVIEKSGGSPTQSTARSAFITPGVLVRNGGNVVCSNFCEAFSFVDFQASAFFYYTWKMFYDNGIMFNYEGKTSGIRNFMTDTFLANLWIVPPQNLIESFFAKAKAIHAKIDANISESIKLTALRDKLLPLLMNGQVTVK